MIEIKTKLKKWGNSYGIIVPQKAIEHESVKEGEEIIILLNKEKNNVLKEMFGSHKFSKSTKKLMEEINKELYDI